jgi:L-alanine-DL-glutamate epimerase-like enolase superfamily enzyme
MQQTRRDFTVSTLGAGLLAAVGLSRAPQPQEVGDQALIDAGNAPVLRLGSLTNPVIIESIEFLKGRRVSLVRTRSKDGAVGVSVTNEKASFLYPLLLQQVAPFFVGKDARDLESLLDGVYVYDSNYKMQGLAFWCCVAWVELSILDLLGKTARKHVSELFGGRVRESVPIYTASGNRGTTPEEEVRILQGHER